MFNSIGIVEIVIIAVVLLLLFGGKKLPELGRGIGQSVRELKKVTKTQEKKKSKK